MPFNMPNTKRQTDPRYSASLAMPDSWSKTKKKKDGNVTGFTFRGEGGLLYLRLGAPQLVDPDAATPQYRFSFELSHTHHLPAWQRTKAAINDRVFFAQGHIVLFTDDPKPENFKFHLTELVEEYNIAVLRVGRIFVVPPECLGKRDSPTGYASGGYALLGIKMDVNKSGGYPGYIKPAGYDDADADWTLQTRYMLRQAHKGFAGAQQVGGVDKWGHRGTSTNYVPEHLLGPEVLEDTAGEVLTEAIDAMLESTKEHFTFLQQLAHTAADLSLPARQRVEAAERLNGMVSMKTYSYGGEKDFHYIATPREPVEAVMAAVKSLIAVMPDIVE